MADPLQSTVLEGPSAPDALAATLEPGEQDATPGAGVQRSVVSARVGRYVVLRQLGEGGMGVVFAAYDEELDRKVAVKLLREAGPISVERKTRILREAQAMARVSHPNVVSVYEVGEVGGQVFIAMEFVDGSTLNDWQRGKRSWEDVLAMYVAAGQGLAAAHRAGLIHRDFKPDNVLVGADGRPRVADFGLARSEGMAAASIEVAPVSAAAVAASQAEEPAAELGRSGSSQLLMSPLTVAGTILGTPAYMSPEQHRGEPADSRSDQFSFCASLYEALYKRLPFAGETLPVLAMNVIGGKVRPTPHPSPIPAQVARALLRGLSADPGARFESMAELLKELNIDPALDPAAAPLARRIFTGFIVCAVMLSGFLLHFGAKKGAELSHQRLLIMNVLLFLGASFAAWRLRKTLLLNAFHRGIVKVVLIFLLQFAGLRGLALLLGLSMDQLLPIDSLLVAGMVSVLASLYLPLAWPLVGISVAMAVVEIYYPAQMRIPVAIFYPAMTIALTALWGRAGGDQPQWEAEQRAVHIREIREKVNSYISTVRSKSGANQGESAARDC